MPIIRAQVVIPHVSGLPEDAVSNTFHFNDSGDTEDWAGMNSALFSFYATPITGIDQYLSPVLDAESTVVKFYDLSDPEPRVPKATLANNLGATAGDAIPSEVCVKLTAQGARVSGQPQARRRGGVFIGPLNTQALGYSGLVPRVADGLRTAIANAASDLCTNSGSWPWSIYSPTNNAAVEVIDGWVDNAFDTQRRRGELTTARTLWTD